MGFLSPVQRNERSIDDGEERLEFRQCLSSPRVA